MLRSRKLRRSRTDELGHVCHGVVEDAGLLGIAAKMFEAVGAGK